MITVIAILASIFVFALKKPRFIPKDMYTEPFLCACRDLSEEIRSMPFHNALCLSTLPKINRLRKRYGKWVDRKIIRSELEALHVAALNKKSTLHFNKKIKP